MPEIDFMKARNFFAIGSHPYGISYGRWTVEWWRWFLSIPSRISPASDDSGKYSFVNQPARNVWYLAGKIGDEDKNFPKRFCKIPSSRSILFPVINCEANPLESPDLSTERDLIEHVSTDENSIISKECFLDNKPIPPQRVSADPPIFEIELKEHNPFKVNGGKTFAAADGYWVFLKPLPRGKHSICFHGSCEYGKLNSGAEYELEIYED